MKFFHNIFPRVTLFVALLFFLFTEYARGGEFDYQCLWVVRNTIISPDKIDKMLDFALENNFNHLMIQVRGRGEGSLIISVFG